MAVLKEFKDYWDGVIASWLKEQGKVFDSDQNQILSQEWLNLSRNHMPEPYWGNPEECSIVIANYNPGGGADRNRHAYFKCADWEHTFIHEVKKSKYSDVASGFPIINEPNRNDLESAPEWWEDYGGSKWWRKKHDWLKNSIINNEKLHDLFDKTKIKECGNKKPFAIEFCGWHSKSWPVNACERLYKDKELQSIIDKYFINVLVEAIKCSDSKLGVCTGKQLYDLLISKYEGEIQDKELESQKYNLHLLELEDEGVKIKILSVWGETNKRNRFPDLTK